MFLRFCVGGKGISIPDGNGDMLADGNDGLLHSAAWVGDWNIVFFAFIPSLQVAQPSKTSRATWESDLAGMMADSAGGMTLLTA